MGTWVALACYLSFLYKPYPKKKEKKTIPKSITVMAYYTPVALHNHPKVNSHCQKNSLHSGMYRYVV